MSMKLTKMSIQAINIRLVYKRIKDWYGETFGRDFPKLEIQDKDGYRSAFISLPLHNRKSEKDYDLDFFITSSRTAALNSIEISAVFELKDGVQVPRDVLNDLNDESFELKYHEDDEKYHELAQIFYAAYLVNTRHALFVLDEYLNTVFDHDRLTELQNQYQD